MNLIWNKNINLFKNRFPSLYDLLSSQIEQFNRYAGTNLESTFLYPFWEIQETKNGKKTAIEQGLRLHSLYNPEREAESAILAKKEEIQKSEAAVFLGFALGYSPICFANLFPTKKIILIEPNASYFFAAMLFLDFEILFSCKNLVLALSCPPDQAITLINQNSVSKSVFFKNQAFANHAKEYFTTLEELIQRNRQKEEINTATLKKFRTLWYRNSRRNIKTSFFLDGINCFKNKAKDIPFLVIAAGPSLQEILPFLEELKKKTIIVCVDTALKALLRMNVQPDFIILTDPQYWAYMHIARLKAKESILIVENAVYPATFRFECKKIICCQSQIPFGNFFEQYRTPYGSLGAGGSVASCAWNFAHLCGAKTIFVSGLDLSFPKKQTHIKGSSFEQASHINSVKTETAETKSMPLLFSGNAQPAKDYNGNPITTDSRMKMFAWWFESRLESIKDTKTFILSASGMKIPGIEVTSVKNLLSMPEIITQKKDFFSNAQKEEIQPESLKKNFTQALNAYKAEQKKALVLINSTLKNNGSSETDFENCLNALKELSIFQDLELQSNPASSKKEFLENAKKYCEE